jgi:hypothetical protein
MVNSMTTPHPRPTSADAPNALPVIDGLPAIEYIETTDTATGRRYTVQFVDGHSVAFTIKHLDMPYLSRMIVTMRIWHAYQRKYTLTADETDWQPPTEGAHDGR